MTDLSNLRLFATHPHTCSYLVEQNATTVFVDPTATINVKLYSRLSEVGFRRSGSHLYRPHCEHCRACIPARIPVATFTPNRRQRRCRQRNRDLSIATVDSLGREEHYALYERYICERHSDGDMFPPTKMQFDAFLTSEWNTTEFVEFRHRDRLLGVAVSDIMDNGISAVYTYFDPHEERRSLGTFAILHQIERARELGLPAVYLGYWIRQCRKMQYKSEFRPLEILVDNRWVTFQPR
ncbi:arginyltransferase [Exilibacterium tricleocarpae]|uniref:Aspartate/glutamate leucyltransferase n=1 Tax=Exilibacterium tricleocarpae TaxID=2591008 RepID=A0A545T8M4_9GAMM|nr:arginyltransferase [Exilibacterium tricleocarpae]TQV73545.1 arginyltransferase [Exilibacterium tricleocarpae]